MKPTPRNNAKLMYNLPRDTVATLESMGSMGEIDNLYLALNRFSYRQLDRGRWPSEPHGYKRNLSNKRPPIILAINQRMEAIVNSLPFKIDIIYKPEKLMIGTLSPYGNISLVALHPVYGIPYIPGSALKGAIRNCWIQENYGGNEKNALKDKLFQSLFGIGADEKEIANKGSLIFFDAFPMDSYTIRFDVQTPHFKDYYDNQGAKAPTDDISPTPLFLTAVTDTTFRIRIGISNPEILDQPIEIIKNGISMALSDYGIGAKTAIGYGIGEVEVID
ncbi:type III-B CRISPR module RAMP protein Cmr6 [Desulfosporosinus shakirovi]|uniref:type III-B CRISPR module RAMP protein Cmr6 n=1 Tax=Desulfosporosinus shakirovi TaxID=2885154 RepID=UPI001E35EFB2|nr:type III-B CRISPR module RAMP protein Cmr6 [Desulfosporosinus sp. SRJS8]MCB8818360.1 type III-B CRISPR module RAMP protein Cmr6 [Desulfosporosinus sp. SRJS8]